MTRMQNLEDVPSALLTVRTRVGLSGGNQGSLFGEVDRLSRRGNDAAEARTRHLYYHHINH